MSFLHSLCTRLQQDHQYVHLAASVSEVNLPKNGVKLGSFLRRGVLLNAEHQQHEDGGVVEAVNVEAQLVEPVHGTVVAVGVLRPGRGRGLIRHYQVAPVDKDGPTLAHLIGAVGIVEGLPQWREQLVDHRCGGALEDVRHIGLRVAVRAEGLADDDAKVIRTADALGAVRYVGEGLWEDGFMVFRADHADVQLADDEQHRLVGWQSVVGALFVEGI